MSEPRVPTSEASTSQLVTQATEDISRLIRDEMALAKEDLAATGKRVGIGVGLFGTAGTLALYGLGALVAAAILGVATALDPWLSALIVAAALFVVAGIAALIGKSSISKAPSGPQDRVASVKTDVATAKGNGPNHRGA